MKKSIILSVLLALSLFLFNCGGGAGSSSSPKGENKGEPSIVQLLPSHFIAQTNSSITLHARVLDGNGAPVNNMPVNFTNMSPIGVLSALSAKTDTAGIASVTIKSTSTGFATIQTEVNQGVAQVRDRKTVYFSAHGVAQLTPTLTLEVDGLGDPYTLFESGITIDNEVTVTATVANSASSISGSTVMFVSDRAYRIGNNPDADCSDGSDTCDVRFPAGIYAITNDFGEATVPVKVEPSALSSIGTTLNIMAEADVGAFNMVTLFLKPVTVQTITLSANPTTVDADGTSAITAYALTNAGTPVPDGTAVNFRITSGSGGIEPYSQTTDGFAETEFTAPDVTATTTIRASVGGVDSSPISIATIAKDSTGPSVSSTQPTNGATGVGLNSQVTINWNEPVDCSTVSATNITVSAGGWTLISCSGNQARFAASGQTSDTLYTVTVKSAVEDFAGNAGIAYVFSYRTETP